MIKKLNKKDIISFIVRVAIFGALAIVLYCVPIFQFSLPFTPSFLKMHFDEVPILLVGYAYGPLEAIVIILLKGAFKLIQDIPSTGGIGVLIDIIYSSAFILPAVFFYRKKKTMKNAILSLIIGTLCQLVTSSIIGFYTLYQLYGYFYNPMASDYASAMKTIGSLFSALDSTIKTGTEFKICYEFLLPFNAIKDIIVCLVVFLTYKPLRIILEKNKK